MKTQLLPYLKVLFFLVGFQSHIFAIEAPFLISATVQNDTGVTISWRNNDISAAGFLIERKDSPETDFHHIDSIKSPLILVYTDVKDIVPLHLYIYRVRAYSLTTISDTSNNLQVTTLVQNLRKPTLKLNWNSDTSKGVQIIIYDSSSCEIGYQIYRKDGNTSPFVKIANIISKEPKKSDSIFWNDTILRSNVWYSYMVAAYKVNDTLISDTCFIYTFRDFKSNIVTKFTKISEFPISVSGWSALAGDSIILKENNSLIGKFTVINVQDSKNPKFAGYIDSIALLSYPAISLIPAFLKFNVENKLFNQKVVVKRNYLFLATERSLQRYSAGKSSTPIDSFEFSPEIVDAGARLKNLLFLNDSILYILFENYDASSMNTNRIHLFIKVTDSNLSLLSEKFEGGTLRGAGHNYTKHFNPQGIFDDNTIIISEYSSESGVFKFDKQYIWAYEINWNRLYTQETTNADALTSNTGYYISPTQSIYSHSQTDVTNITELFVSDFRDSQGYLTALNNNAVFVDSTITQNMFLDTLNKRVFLISKDKLTILNYSNTVTGVIPNVSGYTQTGKCIRASQVNSSYVKFSFYGIMPKQGILYIYDLSGLIIDNININNSNSIYWNPIKSPTNCFIAVATIGKERLFTKFVIR